MAYSKRQRLVPREYGRNHRILQIAGEDITTTVSGGGSGGVGVVVNLSDLGDIELTSVQNEDTLSFHTASNRWVNSGISSKFLRTDINDETDTGIRTWFGGAIEGQSGSSVRAQINGSLRVGNVIIHSGGNSPNSTRASDYLHNNDGSLKWFTDGSENKVWHSGNDGNNSGLDADLLAGYDNSLYPRKDEDATISGTWTFDQNYNITETPGLNSERRTNGHDEWVEIYSDGTSLRDIHRTIRYGGTISSQSETPSGARLFAHDFTSINSGMFWVSLASITFNMTGNVESGNWEYAIRNGDYVSSDYVTSFTNTGVRIHKGAKLDSTLESQLTFTSGFAGSNWKLDPDDNGDAHLTVDRLTVRGRMDIYELVINKIRATNGSLWVSDSVKSDTYSHTPPDIYAVISVNEDTDITFLENDIIQAQEFDGRNVRKFVSRVTAAIDYDNGFFVVEILNGAPWSGMDLVRIGNTTNTDRQGALYLTSSDSGSPFMDILDGNNDISFGGDIKMRIGKLDGISGHSGYGIWGSRDGNVTDFVISSAGYAKIAGFNFDEESIYTGAKNGTSNTDLTLSNVAGGYRMRSKNFSIHSNGSVAVEGNITVTGGNAVTDTELGLVDDKADAAKGVTDKLDTLATITNNEFKVSSDASNYVRMFLNSPSDWGISGVINTNEVFSLGDENKIAAFTFDEEKLSAPFMELDGSNGSGAITLFTVNDQANYQGLFFGVQGLGKRNIGLLYKPSTTLPDELVLENTFGDVKMFGSNDVTLHAWGNIIFNSNNDIKVETGSIFSALASFNSTATFNSTTNLKSSTYVNGEIHLDSLARLTMKVHSSPAVSGNVTMDTRYQTVFSGKPTQADISLTLSNGVKGRCVVIINRNDSSGANILISGYIGGTFSVEGGGCATLIYDDGATDGGTDQGNWFCVSYYNNNW